MSLCKVWIGGTRNFNNYALVYWFLKKNLPKNAIILSGHAAGPDTIGEMYGYLNDHPVEVYPADWERYGKSAGMVRNAEVARQATHAICFWDNQSPGTKNMIELCERRGIKPMIFDVSEADYIKPHPDLVKHVNHDKFDVYIGRGKNSPWGNPFSIDAKHNRQQVIYMFTDYLLKNPDLLNNISELKGKTLGCYCSPELCHGDVLIWLLENATCELKDTLNDLTGKTSEGSEDDKKTLKPWELDVSNWDENGGVGVLVTSSGLSIAKGYSGIVRDKNIPYLEIKNSDIIKDHIHIPLNELQGDSDLDDRICVFYFANDKSKTKIRLQQVEFSDCEFKANCWYVYPENITIQK